VIAFPLERIPFTGAAGVQEKSERGRGRKRGREPERMLLRCF
jgi:hypothetical protein